jgi:hypothetical protein
MEIELGKKYLSDGQVVTIIEIDNSMKTRLFNRMEYPASKVLTFPVVGITDDQEKRYFTINGFHRWFEEYNLVEIPKYSYPDRIGKYIHNIFKRIYSGTTNGVI